MRRSDFGFPDELEVVEARVARVEDEYATGGSLAVQRALRTAQHFHPVDVDEPDRRRDTEIGDDERHIVEVVADRRVAVCVAAAGAAQIVGTGRDRLALPFEGSRDGAHQIADRGDVLFLQLLAAEGLDGERHLLQRLGAGLLRRDDNLINGRGSRRLCIRPTGLQDGRHRRSDSRIRCSQPTHACPLKDSLL